MTPISPMRFSEVQEGLVDALDGKGYTGPQIEWTCGTLAATTPEPHTRLDPAYMDEDDVLQEVVLGCAIQVGIEQGWRMAVKELQQASRYMARAKRMADSGYSDEALSEYEDAGTLLALVADRQ